MRRLLVIAAIVLLFTPDYLLGAATETSVGLLRPFDAALAALSLLLLLARGRSVIPARAVVPPLLAFVAIALASTLIAPLRYPGGDDPMVARGVVKLGKLVLCIAVGPLVGRTVGSYASYRRVVWGVAIGALASTGWLVFTAATQWDRGSAMLDKEAFPYQAANVLSVSLAVAFCAIVGMPAVSSRGRAAGVWALLLGLPIAAGMLLTGGRGGWLGASAGVMYLSLRRGSRRRAWVVALSLCALGLAMTRSLPQVRGRFERLSDRTTASDPVAGLPVSDEHRVRGLVNEAPKIANSPLIGVGFYNRGRATGLDWWGSHNLYVQLALESGILGLLAFLWLLAAAWRSAGALARRCPWWEQPVAAFHASMLAALVASATGEYLYGGLTVALLSILYATTLALARVAPPWPVHRRRVGREMAAASGESWSPAAISVGRPAARAEAHGR